MAAPTAATTATLTDLVGGDQRSLAAAEAR
jgi:hypothetical protein